MTESLLQHLLQVSPAVLYRLQWREGEPLPEAMRSAPWAAQATGSFVPTFISDRIREMTGFEPDECLDPEWWITHVHADDRASALAAMGRLFQSGRQQHSYRLRTRDGRYIWIEDQLHLLRDEQGRPVEAVGSWLDVSDHIEKWMAYEQMVESAFDGIAVLQDGKVAFVNPTVLKAWGGSKDEVIGRSFLDIVHPEDRAMAAAKYQARMSGAGDDTPYTIRLIAKDGSPTWVEISGSLIEYRGRPAVLVIMRDIGMRKQKEKLDQWRQEILGMIADPDCSLTDVLEAIVHAAQDCRPGMTGSILLLDEDGKHLRHGAAPDLPEDYARVFDGAAIGPKACSCGTAAYCAERVIVKDIAHDPLWEDYAELALSHGLAACWSEPVFGPDGRVLGTFAMYYRTPRGPDAYDIELIENMAALTANAIVHKRAERELNQALERLETIAANVKVVLFQFAVDAGGQRRFSYISGSIEKLLGISVETAMADAGQVFARVHPEEFDGFIASVESAIENKAALDWKGRFVGPEEHILWFDILAEPQQLEDGGWQWNGIAVDETRAHELEQQLVQAQKMEAIGTMAGGIAHDFNNMLAGMLGQLFLLRRDLSGKPESLERIARIEAQGERAADIIRQMLTFARKSHVSMQPLPLASLLTETMKLHRVSLPESIELMTRFDMAEARIRGDAGMIQQVVLNLLTNARDALADVRDARIVMELEPVQADDAVFERHPELAGKSLVCLTVSDNGCGIPESVQESIFDPFFTTKEVGKGTGLGLAMVYGAMQSHEGAIEVDSRLGRGTEFRLYFPRLDAPLKAEALPLKHEAVAGDDVGLLLVDDEIEVRDVLAEALAGIGYRVFGADNGVQALEVFERHCDDIDIAVIDVVMPRMGGVELARRMRGMRGDLPILFHTGYGQQVELGDMLREPLTDTLAKPASIEALTHQVARLLAEAGQQ